MALATSSIFKFMSPKTTKPSVEASAAASRSVVRTTWRSTSCLNFVFLNLLPLISMCPEPERVWLTATIHLWLGAEAPTRTKVPTVKRRLLAPVPMFSATWWVLASAASLYLFAHLHTEGANAR